MTRNSADAYAAALNADYGFESVCVMARHHYCVRQLQRSRHGRVIEIGCGAELLFDRAVNAGIEFDQWVVIEPAHAFAELCRERSKSDVRISVHEAFVQEISYDQIGSCDTLLISGLLHEVDDAKSILHRCLGFLKTGGAAIVTVPNALSFHRLLAREMGLIDDVHQLSERNLRLSQRVVFDADTLRALMESAGLSGLEDDGYLFKPFTHEQMWSAEFLREPALLAGLDRLGSKFSRYGAEIACRGIKS